MNDGYASFLPALDAAWEQYWRKHGQRERRRARMDRKRRRGW